jgi:hypothetical protein
MRVIENISAEGVVATKRAALYYKTEPFFVDVNRYTHTNNWEIKRSIEILVSRGYIVDLIDRGCHNWKPKYQYDIFLGLGVGNSGKNFARYAESSEAPHKILLSMGPQPDISNERTLERYRMFNERTGYYAPPMRTVQDVIGDNFKKIIETADCVFNIGEKGTPSYNSFLPYQKPVINFYPSISPAVSYENEWLKTRDRNSFLCFAGNGFICKGVDIVVEAFLKDPSKNLHICGPPSEASFFDYYGDTINKASNISYHGFIQPGGSKFNELASKCSYVIFHSAAEGCCTSVATAIKAGLVPIINPWTGILIEDCGFSLDEGGNLIENISQAMEIASGTGLLEYEALVEATIKKASLFSQDSFTKSYAAAIDEAMKIR